MPCVCLSSDPFTVYRCDEIKVHIRPCCLFASAYHSIKWEEFLRGGKLNHERDSLMTNVTGSCLAMELYFRS